MNRSFRHHSEYVAVGVCVADSSAPRAISRTRTGEHIPTWAQKSGRFKTSKLLHLYNGDTCQPGNFVIVKDPDPGRAGETFIARVEEIIQELGSIASFSSQADAVLVQKTTIDRTRETYGMPSIQLSGHWSVHATKVGSL